MSDLPDISPEPDFALGDLVFDVDSNGNERDSTHMAQPAAIARQVARRKLIDATKREELSQVIKRIPQPGETFHVVSNGKFDYFTYVPLLVDLLGGKADAYYGSTWTLCRQNAIDLLEMYDQGKLGSIAILTGLYFKRRESAVYATIVEGLAARGQRYVAFQNHAKVTLLQTQDAHLVVEGSANYTANPRLENFTVTNHEGLYEMHVEWMERALHNAKHTLRPTTGTAEEG